MTASNYYIGLISGTSIDGVDCALVRFNDNQPELVSTHFASIQDSLRERIISLCSGRNIDLQELGSVDAELAYSFAAASNELLDKASITASDIVAIGSHGQTVWHQPSGRFPSTLQLADPNIIAQQTGITTVADFRRRDMAVGGQGAPLAPLLHRNCFASNTEDRVVINIGGISNISVLQANGDCLAFDTGPGNGLMDYWVNKNNGKRFDENGVWAATGSVDEKLLSLLIEEAYFSLPPPKSTGRELFNGAWLETKLNQRQEGLTAENIQATLLVFTCRTIANDIKALSNPASAFVCGGGAHNAALMNCLQSELEGCVLSDTSVLGVDPDWVEAIAFAWMAKQTIENKKIDTSAFTGAKSPVILGGVYKI